MKTYFTRVSITVPLPRNHLADDVQYVASKTVILSRADYPTTLVDLGYLGNTPQFMVHFTALFFHSTFLT